jgi:FAD/FMN-containing dehydrogenase
MLAFDPETGVLTCEAGLTFDDLLRVMVPKGWFPPVTPGTRFVTMGGALASDIHGKNHHREGAFSRHVLSFDLLTGAGEIIHCSRSSNPEIFRATAGGMGLTGMILRLTIRLRPIETSAIRVESVKAANLDEILSMFDDFETATYTVAWIDCISGGAHLGRSILLSGEHASRDEVAGTAWDAAPLSLPRKPRISVPLDLPAWTLNRFSIAAFNTLYYHKQLSRKKMGMADYEGFFYPLDAILHWNRIYGRKGFTQYQFVVPRAVGRTAVQDVLHRVQRAGVGSFLSVLKLLGEPEGMIAFPQAGYTLTLDFPISDRLFPLLDTLDEVVCGYGGRVYLTKDVRLRAETLARMYPELDAFKAIVRELDPQGHIKSLQGMRLGLC